jgi:formate hydrogenlyase transcriptional activator
LGTLVIASLRENAFTEQDAELLMPIAGQIAIAVESALAYREITALKNKLASEKIYLEEEIETEYNFEEIIGRSTPLKHVLKEVEIVAPADRTLRTGAQRHAPSRRSRRDSPGTATKAAAVEDCEFVATL